MSKLSEAVLELLGWRCCSGEWIDGSGGHRTHKGACKRVGTYEWTPGGWYCDEHNPSSDNNERADDADDWVTLEKAVDEFMDEELRIS